MLVIGLTGSIATGKSTVSHLLTSPPHSLPLIDADAIARLVVAPHSPGLAAITAHFSPFTPNLLHADGTLNRAALGSQIFGSTPEARRNRKVLDGITHPLVRKEMARELLRHWIGGRWAVVCDVPLLFEAGMDGMCGAVVVVAAGEEVQMERLMKRDGAGVEDARRRVGSQMSVAEKVRLCEGRFGERGWVVDNNRGMEELRAEVERVVRGLEVGRRGWWRWVCWTPVGLGVAAWRVLVNWWRKREWEKREAVVKAKL